MKKTAVRGRQSTFMSPNVKQERNPASQRPLLIIWHCLSRDILPMPAKDVPDAALLYLSLNKDKQVLYQQQQGQFELFQSRKQCQYTEHNHLSVPTISILVSISELSSRYLKGHHRHLPSLLEKL